MAVRQTIGFESLTRIGLIIRSKISFVLAALAVLTIGLSIGLLPLSLAAGIIAGSLFLWAALFHPPLALSALLFIIPFSSNFSISVASARAGGMELLLALIAGVWLLQILTRFRPLPAAPPLILPFLIMLGAMLLSWLNALSLAAALVETIKWLEMLVIYWFIISFLSFRRLAYIIVPIICAGLVEALLGLYQFYFQVGPKAFLLFEGQYLRAYGTFNQPNPFAGYLGLIAPLIVSLLIWLLFEQPLQKHLPSRILQIVALVAGGVVIFAAMLASGSRGAWLGAAAALTVTLVLRKARLNRLVLLLAIAALPFLLGEVGNILPPVISQRFNEIIPATGIAHLEAVEIDDANFASIERLAHWQAALDMWRDHFWLGAGIGNYAAVYPTYAVGRWSDPLGHAHNYYLNFAAETGFLGLLAYLFFWLAAARLIWRALGSPDAAQRALAAGAAGVLVHFSVHNLFDNLYVNGMYLHIAAVLGIIAIIAQEDGRKS